MTRGRKPKPTALKEITGNPGRRPLNASEPKPPPSSPRLEPPSVLNALARVEWRRMIGRLTDVGLMTDLDVAALAAYCQLWARWSQAEIDLDAMAQKDPSTHGTVIRTTKGNYVQNPLVGVANQAMERMLSACAEFGMTPSARSRLNVEVGSPTPEPGEPAGADGQQPPAPQPAGAERFFH